MFREMRRKRQQLSEEECEKLLKQGTHGVLSVHGDDGYPYGIPISYFYYNRRIIFHCARSGHKMDALLADSKVSFCVVGQDHIVPEEYTTYFRSVIVFGRVHFIEKESEIWKAARLLAARYYPEDSEDHRDQIIRKEMDRLCMAEIFIDHMTGKEAIELVKKK